MRSKSPTLQPRNAHHPASGHQPGATLRSGCTRATLLGLFLLLACGVALPAVEFDCDTPPEALIVTRHACKVSDCADSPLARRGKRQARKLKRDLGSLDIAAIFVTVKKRTQKTAEPLGRLRFPTSCDGNERSDHCLDDSRAGIEDLLERICSPKYAGRLVLYVGHSYTLKQLFEELGIQPIPDFREAEPWKIPLTDDSTEPKRLELKATTPGRCPRLKACEDE